MRRLQRIYSASKRWGLFLCLACDTAQNGITSLIQVIPEPPGANCPNGGSLIEAGQDINADGQLAPAEVTATTFVCNGEGEEPLGPVLEGSFTIENEDDVARFQDVEEVTGNLIIDAAGLSSASFPNLTTVNGELRIFEMDSIDLPGLEFVGVGFVTSANITNIPKLVSAGSENTTNAPSLLIFASNGSDVSVFAGSLTLVEGSLSIAGEGTASPGASFTFEHSLQTITQQLEIGNTRSVSLASFPEIQLLESLNIHDNPGLTDLDFPSLANATDLTIRNNPLLPDCQAQNLLAQLVTPPVSVSTTGNNGTGTCP